MDACPLVNPYRKFPQKPKLLFSYPALWIGSNHYFGDESSISKVFELVTSIAILWANLGLLDRGCSFN
jgi:hypothetical protein